MMALAVGALWDFDKVSKILVFLNKRRCLVLLILCTQQKVSVM